MNIGTKFFHWQNTGASLQVVTTHSTGCLARAVSDLKLMETSFALVVLQMRLYAMYGSSRFILALLVLLLAGEVAVMAVIFGKTQPGQVCESMSEYGPLLEWKGSINQ